MGILLESIKCCVLAFNLICMILGIGFVGISFLGLEDAKPGTIEHTYFIVGIILGALICIATLFGCYGIVCEIVGLNITYAFFILILLILQYLQMQTFLSNAFYRSSLQRLDEAWHLLPTKPYYMRTLESKYHCCGLYNSRDYNYKRMNIPNSCYRNGISKQLTNLYTIGCLEVMQDFYQYAIYREKVFTWSIMISECIVFIYSVILIILLYRQNHHRRHSSRPVQGLLEQRTNHIDALRTRLL